MTDRRRPRSLRYFSLITLALTLTLVPLTASGASPSPEPHTIASPTTFTELWLPPTGHALRVQAAFSLPNGPYQAGHRGIDVPAEVGAEVRAPTGGTVSFAGWVVNRPVVSIRVDEQTVISLEPVEADVVVQGDTVSRGQTIGSVSQGGHCEQGCVHLGVRVDGDYVNPMRYFRPRPVLLPW